MTCCKPYWHLYPGAHMAQSVYIELDGDGAVTVDYSPDDSSTPCTVFNGETLRWRIESSASQLDVDDILEHIKPWIVTIVENSEIIWRDNYTRKMNEVARKADDSIAAYLQNYDYDFTDFCGDEDCKYCADMQQ